MSISRADGPLRRAPRPPFRLAPGLALSPTWAAALVVYMGTVGWTVWISMTDSRMLPNGDFVGLDQYARLLANARWLVAVENMLIFGVLFISACLVLGFALAVAIERLAGAEAWLRTVFLYPYALSFIITGLVWRWLMDPGLGLGTVVRGWGWEGFAFDLAVRSETAVYALVIAGVWQGAGVVMALMLAGLRGVDPSLWAASRIDGIPTWRMYAHVVVPLLWPMVATALLLLSIAVVKVYDLVVALTGGGPGIASEMPAKFVMDHLFARGDVGLAAAGATLMLLSVVAMLVPLVFWHSRATAR